MNVATITKPTGGATGLNRIDEAAGGHIGVVAGAATAGERDAEWGGETADGGPGGSD